MRKKLAVGLAVYFSMAFIYEQFKHHQQLVILEKAIRRTQRVSEAMLKDLVSSGHEFHELHKLIEDAHIQHEFEALTKDL